MISEIKKDAMMDKTNVNSYIARILTNHILWEKYERKMGLLPMTKPFIKHSLRNVDGDEIVHLAREIEKDTFSDILNFIRGSYTVSEFIEILRSWLYVAWMQHDVRISHGKYVFKINHDLGEKWSLYVKTLVTELFHDIMQKSLDVKSTKNTVTIVFPPD